jgi:hypothetical protein
VRVVIAEDLFLLRDGLTRLLHAHGFEVAAAVDNGADLLAAVLAAGTCSGLAAPPDSATGPAAAPDGWSAAAPGGSYPPGCPPRRQRAAGRGWAARARHPGTG